MEDLDGGGMMMVGIRFEPSDASLIGHLYSKVTGMGLGGLHHGHGEIIKEFDLYGEKEPWEIWDLFGGGNQDLYLFTQLKRKSQNGSRISRSIGSGTWMSEDSGKPIAYSGLSLGLKKRLRYENRLIPRQMRRWIMHEYSLDSNLVHTNGLGYVLCRIRKNDRGEDKRRKF